jgi:hypothetical protein
MISADLGLLASFLATLLKFTSSTGLWRLQSSTTVRDRYVLRMHFSGGQSMSDIQNV